jgi:hypothetical protein
MSYEITIHDRSKPVRQQVYLRIEVKDPDAEGKCWYSVERLGKARIGEVKAPRADHPHYRAQLIRRVLDSAFPFVPNHTHSRTPRGPEAVARY